MQKIIEFLSSHWDSIVAYSGTVAGVSGWLSERKKRMRDNRDSDVAFWEKTIDRQNLEIAKLEGKIDAMRARYEEQIQKMQDQIIQMSAKLEVYESQNHKTIHTL